MDENAAEATRCVVVVDESLPPGRAANAAAVIALTLGKRHPHLAGPDLIDVRPRPSRLDSDRDRHPCVASIPSRRAADEGAQGRHRYRGLSNSGPADHRLRRVRRARARSADRRPQLCRRLPLRPTQGGGTDRRPFVSSQVGGKNRDASPCRLRPSRAKVLLRSHEEHHGCPPDRSAPSGDGIRSLRRAFQSGRVIGGLRDAP
jgi:Protein of unknown function (DUF2000)